MGRGRARGSARRARLRSLGGRPALSRDLEAGDGAGDPRVEGLDGAELGDGDHVVAARPHEPAEPALLAADDEGDRPSRQVEVVDRPLGLRGEPDGPTPAAARSRSAVGTPPMAQNERCSIAPAAVLVTAGVSRTARCVGSTTPVTPAHSALRSSAPRLRGSVTPSHTRRNASSVAQLVEGARRHRVAARVDALVPLGARLTVDARPRDVRDDHATSLGCRLDGVELLGGVERLGDDDALGVPTPRREQLEDRPAPLDLVAAERVDAAQAACAAAVPPGASSRAGPGSRRPRVVEEHDRRRRDPLGRGRSRRGRRSSSP